MPLFRYKAARNDGTVIDGQLEAADEQRAAQVLQAQGHVPIQIDSAVGQAASGVTRQVRRSSKANAATIDFFTLELATLLRAGLPLAQALETLTGLADSPAMAELAESVNTLVRDGQSLSNALEQTHPGFDAFYCNMVRAGESSGALDLALERLAEFRASRRELRNSLISALIYPVILLVMALIAVAVLLAFVVPQFTQMFADAGRELPLLTRIVAGAGEIVTNYWWLIIAVIGGSIWWAIRDWRTPTGRLRWDRWLINAILVGPLVRKLNAARFARTLATLLDNGVHLMPALGIAKEIVGNSVMAQGLDVVAERVREGAGLSAPLAETEVLPPLATQLIRLGESSGKLEMMLTQVADIYERDVQNSMKRLLTLAEPVIIIMIALLVTVIILSVVLMILESNNLAF
ncbi:type II secretion system F family protein [Thiosocius teredinicola]|uniref:type II secretion system F family protein n=1 Tax=Thiosocius teredinicola TaxID=1973002 RepID=UPI000990DD65